MVYMRYYKEFVAEQSAEEDWHFWSKCYIQFLPKLLLLLACLYTVKLLIKLKLIVCTCIYTTTNSQLVTIQYFCNC